MSHLHTADLFSMNRQILSFDLPQDSAGPMSGDDMDRHIDRALQTFGLGWSDDCFTYNTCGVDVDNQCVPNLGGIQ